MIRTTIVQLTLVAPLLMFGCSDEASMSETGGTGGGTGGSGGGTPSGSGSATLTIGSETWEFDSFGCAFGYDATQSEVYSFSSSAFGEHSSGARVQMQADIRDDSGQERLEGEGVIYEVYITDIEDFEDPAVDWEAIGPADQIIVRIDGDRVTAEGEFDDLRTDLEIEAVPGTLDATCGNQSAR